MCACFHVEASCVSISNKSHRNGMLSTVRTTSTHCKLILCHTPARATGGESPGSPPSHDWPTGGYRRLVVRGSGHREQVVVVLERKKR